MKTFQFVLLKVWFEAPVLLREVICDVFLRWLSWELAAVTVIALYLCQAHMSVLPQSKEAGSMEDSTNQISFEIMNEKEGSGNTQKFSQLRNNWRKDFWSRNIRQIGKAVPLKAWSSLEVSRKLRFPDFMTKAQDGGKVVSLTHRPLLPPGNAPGTHFC